MKSNNNDRIIGDYYLGLDIGTESIGWAATDTEYNILRAKGKSMWGVRLFEEANKAADRRSQRTARRRLARRKQRLLYLEQIFADEISKLDPAFFRRLESSSLFYEERDSILGKYSLFNDADFTDVDYLKKYPTIYHLRQELIHSTEPHDIRLVYLALHHIVKYRGHFLFAGSSDKETTVKDAMDELEHYLNEEYDAGLNVSNADAFIEALKDSRLKITEKKALLRSLTADDKYENISLAAICDLLAGAKVGLDKLFKDKELKADSFSLSDDLDQKLDALYEAAGDRADIIFELKAVFNAAREAQILGTHVYLSDAKVELYNKNRTDLRRLKQFVRQCAPEKYSLIFCDKKEKLNNYAAYSRYKHSSGDYSCKQEDFCAFLKKTLPELADNADFTDIYSEIEQGSFLSKLRGSGNGSISYQIQKRELVRILENASGYLPLLDERDENGISAKEKIISIFEFRIPYYVGPLNTASDKAWLTRGSEKIYPWNFDSVVDKEQSAKNFMENLVGRDSYTAQRVLPKDSLLFSRFTVLNEINPLKINGKPIPVSVKQDIFEELFVRSNKKVTKKTIHEFLMARGECTREDEISGIDDVIKSRLRSRHDLALIIEKTGSEELTEDIIEAILIYGEDKRMLKNWRKKNCPMLDKKDMAYICRLKYKDWGRLSKCLLTEVYHTDKDGVAYNIMDCLWQTNHNLMQLLSDEYGFAAAADKIRKDTVGSESIHDKIDSMYIRPAVKRSVWQALRIIDEIVDVRKCAPKKLFIEVARGGTEEQKKKGRIISRKEQLLELYKSCKKDEPELYERLQAESDEALRRDKLYLYYTQFGRCMYSGEIIDLARFESYDIDHIFPQSRIKDDSLENRVLVKNELNREKTNSYPISDNIRGSMLPFWKTLHDKKLIGDKKFERLKRNYPLTEAELSSFIARQIVDTQQSTKAVAAVVQDLYRETKVIYSKAMNVTDFRREFKMFKCRDVNDLHHAKDAYLNIVVGNVYSTRFTDSFFKNILKEDYSIKTTTVFGRETKGAWHPDYLGKVIKQLCRNDILFTRMPHETRGQLFNTQLVPAGKGQLSVKAGKDIDKYGGYNKISGAYFAVVESSGKKGARLRTIEPVFIYNKQLFRTDPERYCTEVLGLKEPKVICPMILVDSMLELNGSRLYISSRTGNRNIYKHAYQLALSADEERYISRLTSFANKCAKQKAELEPTSYDGISREENLSLYDTLSAKLCAPPYKNVLSALADHITNHRDDFISLNVAAQAKLLLEILKSLRCNIMTSNLNAIGEGATIGRVNLSNDISKCNTAYLIHQSVTGLYEHKTDLLK